ncbi:hypothetical protein PCC6912_54750 [Chlorogloeopsis fritschii PCC 6912]|uniref:Uncharacterized protein n=1 Tax=Chlorogloeopsis fritschii PCC 6912 TaxID=211165 RepID=A0A433MZK1_CHLFR|nr:hypothetical protein PCC6912_54750 [Chlorogloeopsis fritschii PCC 6912]
MVNVEKYFHLRLKHFLFGFALSYSNPNDIVRKYVNLILGIKVKFYSDLALINCGYPAKNPLRWLFQQIHASAF